MPSIIHCPGTLGAWERALWSLFLVAGVWLTHGVRGQPARQTPMRGARLGVATAQVVPALRTHLDLPEGVGLVVSFIAPNSPAADVLETHDVLRMFGDQILVDSRQLAVLVRMHKPGDDVEIELIRRGESLTAKVRLGEGEMLPLEQYTQPRQPTRGTPPPPPPPARVVVREAAKPGPNKEVLRRKLNSMRESKILRLLEQRLRNSNLEDNELKEALEGLKQLKKLRNDLGLHDPSQLPGTTSTVTTRVLGGGTTRSAVHTGTEDGNAATLTVDGNTGKQLTISAADGTRVFEGPVNTDQERQQIPAAWGELFEQVVKQTRQIEKRTIVIETQGQAEPVPAE